MSHDVQQRLRFGRHELDVRAGELRRDGVAVPLRRRPFELLRVFAERAGRLVTKDELLDLAWPGLVVEENNLQVQVSALRKVLGPEVILTIPGRGYRFTPVVECPGAQADAAGPAGLRPALPRGLESIPRLPAPMFGRDADTAAVSTLLREHRLVTLAGPGGIGKTRLAQAVARAAVDDAIDAVAWVELAPLSQASLVVPHVAAQLGVELAAGSGSSAGALAAALRARRQLLVLDNAEHLLDEVAALARELLQTPALRLLVTSQAPLRLSGEQVHRLAELDVPPPGASPADAQAHAAVALFVARARSLDRGFALDATNTEAVIDICRRLDGNPLAIELAAARVRVFGVNGLAAQLDQRFRLLCDGTRDAPSRQQTLAAVFDWSHRLLTHDEECVFHRLGAFAGPFSLDDAAAVAADAQLDRWSVIELLGALVDRSLVAVDGGDPPRYRLPETARAYALERLRDDGDAAALRRASRLVEAAGDRASLASASAEAVARYSHALELARMAEDMEATPDADPALALTLKLGPAFQTALGPAHPRCEELYREAVERSRLRVPDVPAYQALWGHWQFLCMCGRNREAVTVADEITRVAPLLGDDGLVLEAVHAAMTTQQLLGNAGAMLAQAERAIGMYRRERHHRLAFAFGGHDPGICALGQAAVGLWLAGRDDEAFSMAERAIEAGDGIEHGYSRATSLYYPAIAYAAAGRNRELRRCAQRLVDLSAQHGMSLLETEGELFMGRARWVDGESQAGLAQLRGALEKIEASGEFAFVLFYSSLLAQCQLADGLVDEAEAVLSRAVRHADAGQGFFLPELHRLRAHALRARGDDAAADAALREAIALAAQQGALALARQAQRDLARH